MPYIEKNSRPRFDEIIEKLEPTTSGELNYIITKIVDDYITYGGKLSYTNVNDVIGVLECAKLELYRRLAAPYEDKKCIENGDVYKSNG